MHIVAGLSPNYIIRNRTKGNNYEKIDELMKVGATEFFVGYVPNYWYEKYGFEISPNGRQNSTAQIQSKEELSEISKYIKERKGEMLITLNANSYNETVWDLVKKIIQDGIDIGVDGFIVSDLGVLDYLEEIKYQGKINVSTIFNVYNSESVKFLINNYKINRIVLPREVTLKEIKKITSDFPNVNFEVFLSGDHCIWNNGSCFTEHNTKGGTTQFNELVSGNPHSYCQFIEKNYIPKKITNYKFKDILIKNELSILDNEIEDNLDAIGNKLLYSTDIDKNEIFLIYNRFKNKAICIYDNSYSKDSEYNKNVIKFFKGLELQIDGYKILDGSLSKIGEKETKIKNWVYDNLEKINFGITFFENRIKEYGIEYVNKVDLLEWNRNGFETLDFLKNIKNIEAVKVPSRGKELQHIRDYITGTIDKEEYKVKNFLSYNGDNSTRKFNYYNSIDNTLI